MCSMFIWLVEYTVLHILENNVKIFMILLVIKNFHTVIELIITTNTCKVKKSESKIWH